MRRAREPRARCRLAELQEVRGPSTELEARDPAQASAFATTIDELILGYEFAAAFTMFAKDEPPKFERVLWRGADEKGFPGLWFVRLGRGEYGLRKRRLAVRAGRQTDSAAISAMHEDPGRRWTLQALAEHAGMSRTSVALRFKETVGVAPMDYLTRWRMLVAGERLVTSGEPISVLAPSLGYESESPFSTAFKRIMRCSPRQYTRP